MIDKSNDVAYMTRYLRYALEFEKYIYVWTKTLNKLDSRIKNTNNEIQQLQASIDSSTHALNEFDYDSKINEEAIHSKISKYKKNSKIALIVAIIFFVIIFVVSCIVGTILYSSEGYDLPFPGFVLVIGLISALVGSSVTMIAPVCIGVSIYFSHKASQTKSQSKIFLTESFSRREKEMYQEELSRAQNALSNATIRAKNYSYRYQEVTTALQEARATLNNIYSENVLHPEYRDLFIIAALCGYLEKGRCITIKGHGGIYDTYDTEKIQIDQLASLLRTEQMVSHIDSQLSCIYDEVKKANNTLNSIDSKMDKSIEIQRSINSNIELNNQYSKQIAESNEYIRWKIR